MKYTFSQFQTHFANKRGYDAFSKLSSAEQTLAKQKMNELLDRIWHHKIYSFTGEHGSITTVAQYNTGTVSGTIGKNVLTGDSTNWPASQQGVPLEGQIISVGNHFYKIRLRTAVTRIVLESPLVETIAAGSGYTIYTVFYPFRHNFGAVKNAKSDLDRAEYVEQPRIPVENETNVPEFLYAAGHLKSDFYSTGTVSVTNGSKSVTSSGAAFTEEMTGKNFTLKSSPDFYLIDDVDEGADTLTLDRPYGGATAATQNYIIDPRGIPLVGVYPYPVAKGLLKFEYVLKPPKLVDDDDLTLLPTDTPMITGIEFMATKWDTVGERGFINEKIFSKREFIESLKTLTNSGGPLKRRLVPARDTAVVSRRDTNPWNRRSR